MVGWDAMQDVHDPAARRTPAHAARATPSPTSSPGSTRGSTLTESLSAQIAEPRPEGMDEEGKLLGGAWTTIDDQISDEHLVMTIQSVLTASAAWR